MRQLCLAIPVLMGLGSLALAEEPAADTEAIRAAVIKALPLLDKGAAGSMAERPKCFTCHNQGLPLMALTTARSRGFAVDDEHLKKQFEFIAGFLERSRENFLAGKGTGGQVATAGQALWALEDGDWQPDDTTSAVAEYLLLFDKDKDAWNHWRMTSDRPPTETSHFTANYVAIRGLKTFGTAEQQQRIEQRIAHAKQWLIDTPAKDTEDRVFRLWSLQLVDAGEDHVRTAAQELLKTQRDNGGWAQLDDMEADAYATGTALAALNQAGGLATDEPAYQRGVRWLLKAQLEDGSWYVKSRSKPFQTYFESGFPHGKDQFISIAASSWAATALLYATPPLATQQAAPLLP
jgi:hypothetical protein